MYNFIVAAVTIATINLYINGLYFLHYSFYNSTIYYNIITGFNYNNYFTGVVFRWSAF
jgi:hypothetical protein